LWAFEGFTSYYDDLFLVRSGVIDEASFLSLLAKTAQGVLRGSGRIKQSLGDSSFDAWTKYYRQDENAPNAVVSYYTKGALVGLCLDLLLRSGSGGRKSLDDVMLALWRDYGAPFDGAGRGVPEDGVRQAAIAAAPALAGRIKRFFDAAIDGTDELPLKKLLATVGVELRVDAGAKPALGARLVAAPAGVKLTHVLDGGGAQMAGLSAGDVLIAVNGIRVDKSSLETLLERRPVGSTVMVHAFRRDELIEREIRLGRAEITVELKAEARLGGSAARLRRAWLAT